MIEINGKIDTLDLEYLYKHVRKEDPIMAGPCPRKNGKINPQTTRFFWKNGQMTDVVHVKPIYYEALDGKWYSLRDVSYGFGNHWIHLKEDAMDRMTLRYLRWLMKRMELINGLVSFPFPKLGMKPIREGQEIFFTVTTKFPDAGTGNTTIDGSVLEDDTTWDAAHDATSGSGGTRDTETTGFAFSRRTNSGSFSIHRTFASFDFSAVTDTDSKDSGILSFWGISVRDNHTNGARDVGVVEPTPANDNLLVDGDFDQCGSVDSATEGATRITFASLSTGQYNDWTLTSTGLGFISLTGISNFGLRTNYDLDDLEPSPNNANGSGIDNSFADEANTTQDPKCALTHSEASVGASTSIMLMGLGT